MSEVDLKMLVREIAALSRRVEHLEKIPGTAQPSPVASVQPELSVESPPPAKPPANILEVLPFIDMPPAAEIPAARKAAQSRVIAAPLPPPQSKPQAQARTNAVLELESAGTWLGLVAVVCFILAAAFLVKLGIDNGWLTPQRQMAGSLVFGLLLAGTGLLFRERDAWYLSFLPAAGIVVCYISVFSGHLIHHLYDAWPAAFYLSAVTAFCLALFLGLNENVYAVLATTGTYLVPILISEAARDTENLCLYFLAWDLVFALLGILGRNRFILILTANLAVMIFGFSTLYPRDEWLSLVAGFQALQFILFAVCLPLFSSLHKDAMSEVESWACFPLLLIFYALEYMILQRWQPGTAAWDGLGFAALLYATYALAALWLKRGNLPSRAMVLAFSAVVIFHAFYLQILSAEAKPWFGLALGLAFAASSLTFDWQDNFIPAALIMATVLMESGRVFLGRAAGPAGVQPLLNLLFGLSGFSIAGWLPREKENHPVMALLLFSANLQVLAGFWRLASWILLDQGAPAGSATFMADALWAFHGLALIGVAWATRRLGFAYSALGVLFFVSAKLLIVDVAPMSPLVRIACLLVLGVLLYLAGFFYRRLQSWEFSAG